MACLWDIFLRVYLLLNGLYNTPKSVQITELNFKAFVDAEQPPDGQAVELSDIGGEPNVQIEYCGSIVDWLSIALNGKTIIEVLPNSTSISIGTYEALIKVLDDSSINHEFPNTLD